MYTYDYYITQFTEAKIFVQNKVQPLSTELFTISPGPDRWCIAEIMLHLSRTAEVYTPVIKTAIETAPDSKKYYGEPFKIGFLMKKFVHIVSPENQKLTPTLPIFYPTKDGEKFNKEAILKEFTDSQNLLIELVSKSKVEHLVLNKLKVRNPVYNAIRMDVNACLAILEAHQRRHFAQIEALLSLERSPAPEGTMG